MGVRSPKELVAHVVFEHYQPRIGRGAAVAADGWFAPETTEAPGLRATFPAG